MGRAMWLTLAVLLSSSVGSAQTQGGIKFASLPVQLDLEPAATGGFVSDLPSSDYKVMLPDQLLTLQQPIGWSATLGAFSVDAVHLDPAVLVALGSGDDEFAARFALLRDGHQFQGPGTRTLQIRFGLQRDCRVKVTVGELGADSSRGMRVYVGPNALDAQLVTREVDPQSFQTPPLPPEVPPLAGIWPRTLGGKAGFTGNTSNNTQTRGGYRTLWFKASTGAQNILSLTFEPQLTNWASISSVEVYKYNAPPISFVPGTGLGTGLIINTNWALTSSDSTNLSTGVAALTSGNIAGAYTAFSNITSSTLTKAIGYLWVCGWPAPEGMADGDGLEWTAANEAEGLLEGLLPSATNSNRDLIVESLDQVREFRRAYRHWRMRGYTKPVVLPGDESSPVVFTAFQPGESMVRNLNLSEALWRNLSSQQVAAVVGNPFVELSPLYFKSAAFLGINWLARSPANAYDPTKPEAPPFIAFLRQHYDLWQELAPYRLNNFPWNDELDLGEHVAMFDSSDTDHDPDYDENVPHGLWGNWGYAVNGKIPFEDTASTVYTSENTQTWWSAQIGQSPPTTPPASDDWAGEEQRTHAAESGVRHWWLDKRSIDGEFGGGAGDDEELELQYTTMLVPFGDNVPEDSAAFRKVAEHSLAPYQDNGQYFYGDGTTAISADVEHTGEYTGDPLSVAAQAYWSDPYFANYGLHSLEHAMGTAHPWMVASTITSTHTYPSGAPTAITPWRFAGWHFDAEGQNPSEPDGDVTLNGRALLPAYGLARMTNNPQAGDLLRKWAEWWWIASMDGSSPLASGTTGTGKWKGIVPALVKDSGGSLIYPSGQWWTGGYDFDGALQYSYFVYPLFLWRFNDPQTPASEKAEYLRPIFHAAKMVAEYWRSLRAPTATPLFDLGTSDAEGTALWTTKQLLGDGEAMRQIALAYPYLRDSTELVTYDQQQWPNGPTYITTMQYVASALRSWGPPNSLLLTPPLTNQTDVDRRQPIVTAMKHVFQWLEAFFPYASNFCAYADRVFMTYAGAFSTTLLATTGGFDGAFPSYLITWERPRDEYNEPTAKTDLQLATFTLPLQTSQPQLTAFVTQFGTQPAGGGSALDLDALIWGDMPLGNYDVHVGTATSDWQYGSDVYSTTKTITRAGDAIRLQFPWAASASSPVKLIVQMTCANVTSLPTTLTDIAVGPSCFGLSVDPQCGTSGCTTVSVDVFNRGTQAVSGITWTATAVFGGYEYDLPPPSGADEPFALGAPNGWSLPVHRLTWQFPYVPPADSEVILKFKLVASGDQVPRNDSAQRTFIIGH